MAPACEPFSGRPDGGPFSRAVAAILVLLSSLIVVPAGRSAAAPAAEWRIEAETGTLAGHTRVVHEFPDGSGRAWVSGFERAEDALALRVNVPDEGFYLLELAYSCDAGKRIPVTVNGSLQGSFFFPRTLGFETRRFGRVFLAAGENEIRVGTEWGYADLDFIRLSPSALPDAFQLRSTPVNPDASPEARALYARLSEAFGKQTFAGQHDAEPQRLARLAQVAALAEGAAPALLGLDLLYYSPTWNHPEGDGAIETALDWALRRKGIVTLSWHWFAPLDGGERVWDSFSTARTGFDASRVSDETSPEHAAAIRDLDRIAEKLKILRDAHVPVLWRPLHEAEGGWFWWGARGPAATRALYRLMFDRFTRVHRLDNLLWVWTSSGDETAPDWYPGDDYVDVVAADLYAPAGARADFFTVFDRLREQHAGRKPVALGECGVMPELNARAPWLWFLTWDDFIARPEFNPPAQVAARYRDPRVVRLP